MSLEIKEQSEVSPFLSDAARSAAIDNKEKEIKDAQHENDDIMCGFWIFKGPLLQRFATETIGTITTLEKRYKIPTKTLGIISVGNDMTTMFGSALIGYYLRKVHRPRWMGIGLFTIVIFCLLNCSLHFIYGAGEDALKLTREFGDLQNITGNLTGSHKDQKLCMSEESTCMQENSIWGPQLILFGAQFILGIGQALFIVIGLAYMDDNTTKSKTPAMLSFSTFLRMLGPAVGYSLASVCLRWYIDPTTEPLIKPEDPRWLGAYWIGWLILAAITFLIACLMTLFPKELPSTRARRLKCEKDDIQNPMDQQMDLSLSGMWCSLKHLATNKVYVYNTFASILYFFGYMVYWIFTPKYIETQYQQSASMATMATGTVALGFSAGGVLLSGYIVSKYQPSARSMAAWNAIVDFLTVAGILCYVVIGCEGSDKLSSMAVTSADSCSASCHCEYVHYAPICSPNNDTYISACHAGCTDNTKDQLGRTLYTGCQCIAPSNSTSVPELQYAVDGPCHVDCFNQFLIFLAVMCFLKLVGASSKSTNLLIALRCIPPEEKSFALGVGSMVASLLGFIPSPIFYGWLIDKYCLVWGKTCSNKGNCWLYDTQALRYTLNLSAASFIVLGGFMNIAVWYHAKNLKIFDEKKDLSGKTMKSLEDITLKDMGSTLQLQKIDKN
ncbi:solute carrier organic anion transporter family member 74D isoform X2 [Drosophila grimshawi]|uniref:solute carrier organic anion transporter family member 74D isoform X2 n=1 Tax=Drosophila grimshawi TaxID=7222 RepID=UPI000C86F876|nr:solute carrier organic anion transporter family member 74D isoform X2 [Drosophila grimshawi]